MYSLLQILVVFMTADAKPLPEITTLSAPAKPAEVLSISNKEVTIRADGKETVLPTEEVLFIDMEKPARPFPALPSLEVRLIDGTLLRCNAFTFRGKQAELRLFSGLALQISTSLIHYVLCDAQDEARRAEFKELLAKKTNLDQLRLLSRDGTAVNTFEGFVGDADAKGETIEFKTDDDKIAVSMARVRGIIFSRRPANEAPRPIAKIQDLFQNLFLAEQVSTTEAGFALKTPAGVNMVLPREAVERFDFSLGKMAYLSELDPIAKEFRFTTKEDLLKELPDKYGRNQTLFESMNGSTRAISIGQKTYSKGLNVHAQTMLEYDVSGYNVFHCVLGIDDQVARVARTGRAGVRIEGDGKELFSALVVASDKPRELELKIAGISRLRIIVDRGDDDDELGDHVDFGDARVTK